MWSRSQRSVLAAVVLSAAGVFLVRAMLNRSRLPDPLEQPGPLAEKLADRIDPNTASWPALAALPSLGEHTAREIVRYREAFTRENPGRIAFERLEDLDKVKGIGPATLESIAPYIVLKRSAPATNQGD
jgi:competence protein ComEA